jgi:hypothetical protein
MAISTIGASALDSGVSQLGKNLIHNGAMTVAQRGTAAVTGSGGYGPSDRWQFAKSGDGQYSRNRSTTVFPDGFAYSHHIDTTTAESAVAAIEYAFVEQRMEAQNLQHLLYGNAAALTTTCSFWVRSTKTGTFCVTLLQPDGTRYFIREYTVNVTDTWEQKSVTFPGDTGGTITNDTGIGLSLLFPIVVGTDSHGSADAWTAGTKYATSNQVNAADNAANEFYITGVQLEVGSVATDFEHEDYGTTLQKCRRYFDRLNIDSASAVRFLAGVASTTEQADGIWQFKVEMRAAPTVTSTAVETFLVNYLSAAAAGTAIGFDSQTTKQTRVYITGVSGSPLTQGNALYFTRDGTDTTYLQASAEL